MQDISNAGLLQLNSKGIEDDVLTKNPDITYFKYAYKANEIFYKDNFVLEDIKIKWNDNYYFKIPKDIEYIGPIWVKITIPYFQISEKKSNYITTVVNNGNINEVIHDNYETFLVIINSIYYLIPIIFLTSPDIKYYLTEIKFNDIKQYFNNIANINISGDTFIKMLSFTPDEYNHHIIPMILNQGKAFDKLMLDKIINTPLDVFCKNLLTQKSFDLYISKYIQDILINNYMDINKYDDLNTMYKIINMEIYYYYNYYLNKIYINNPPIDLDLVRTLEYYNLNSSDIVSSRDNLLKDTITINSLLLQLLLVNLNPINYNTYNFYKKYTVITYPILYDFVLYNEDIVDIDSTGDINLLNTYYPIYTLNIENIYKRIEFKFETTMIFTTFDGYNIAYGFDNIVHKFTINDTNKINLTELHITINTINNTENIINPTITNNDTNINTEWNNNMIKNVISNEIHYSDMDLMLLNDIKKNYYLKEDMIQNKFNLLNSTKINLKNLWIELKTISDHYNTKLVELGFIPYQKNYKLNLYNTDIVDVNNTGKVNLLDTYYPNYTINIDEIYKRIPFILTQSMTFSTSTGLNITYSDTNNVYTLSVDDVADVTIDVLPIIINNNLDTSFIKSKLIIEEKYKYIVNIEKNPQDLTNIYGICINKFMENIMNKYFHNDMFLIFFYNKINSYLYQRYNRISTLYDTNTVNFKGLVFYYNIELKEYITKEQIKTHLSTLFNINTFICYIDLVITPHLLKYNNIIDYNDSSNSTLINKDYTDCFHELKIKVSYTILKTQTVIFENTIVISQSDDNLIELFNNKSNLSGLTTYLIKTNDTTYEIINYTVTNNMITLFTTNNITIDSSSFILYETTIQSIPSLDITEIGNTNDVKVITVYNKNDAINLFEEYNKINIIFNVNSVIILSYQLNNINSTVIVKYDSINMILIGNLYKNYTLYDKIEATIINLPCSYINITNSDCIKNISITYPYIELNKYSSTYINNNDKFKSLNSIKLVNEISVRIVEETDDILYLYCYDNTDTGGEDYLTDIDIIIMDNSYLPNLYNYTSLNTDISSMMDYMIQNPFIIKLKSSTDIPLYCMGNIIEYSSCDMYLDNIYINKIYKMSSDQLIRDNTKLYASHYHDSLLKPGINKSTIESIILTKYDSVYDGLYGEAIDIIESSQTDYGSVYNEIITDINNTTKYGSTIKSLYNTILPLNKFIYISNKSSYVLDPTLYNITSYDVYTNMAISLYNFTNINKNNIVPDNKNIMIMSNKYNYYIPTTNNNTFNKCFINSPWLNYNSSFKLSSQLIQFISNYYSYGKRQLDYIDNNESMLLISNKSNFIQNLTEEYNIKSKYTNLVYDITKVNIELLYPNPWNDYLQNTLDDNISIKWTKDNVLANVDTLNNLYIKTTEPFQSNTTTIVQNLNQNNMLSLIGAIKINNNKIDLNINNLLLDAYKYIVIDNMYVVEMNTSYKFLGLNYKSSGLILNTMTEYTFNKLSINISYYQIEIADEDNYFNTTDNYIIKINDTIGYMKYTGIYMVILLANTCIIGENTKMFYTLTNISSANLFDYIFNNTNEVFLDNLFIFNDMKITTMGVYNYYNKISWSISEFIIMKNNILIPQYYSDYIYILDCVFINYYQTTDTILNLQIYTTSSVNLPPLIISDLNINIFNPINDINWIDNKNDWLNINNITVQVKDLDNIIINRSIPDGNYLLYHGNMIDEPIILKNPDIFYDIIQYNMVEYNPYKNCYMVVGSTNNLINPTKYLANNNVIESIVEISDDMNIFIHPQNENIKTIILLKDTENNIYCNRPIIITNVKSDINYTVFDNLNNMTDNYISILQSNIDFNPIFVKKLVFSVASSITTNSQFITIETISSTEYKIYLINSNLITMNMNHMININVNNVSNIVFWLYIGNITPFNLLYNGDMVLEPHYIDYYNTQNITTDNSMITFISVDTSLFTLVNNSINSITTNIIPTLNLQYNSYVNFDEISELYKQNNNINAIESTDKNINSILNTWEYIDNVKINNDIINSNNLSKYNEYIIISATGAMYYNKKKTEYLLEHGIVILSESMNIIEGDVYIYPSSCQFISCQLSCINENTKMYIYVSSNNIIQRNEIIKLGEMIVIVNSWSIKFNCYIGTILNQISSVPNILSGYYSYGKFSNYYEKNLQLTNNVKQNQISRNLLYGINNTTELVKTGDISEKLLYGDYYIENNIMYIYNGEIIDNTTTYFKFKTGHNITLYRTNSVWYYDNTSDIIDINTLFIYNTNQLIVDTSIGNIVTFKTDTIDESINKITCYVPNQPFTQSTITVLNNSIINITNFNGWIELYNEGILLLYRVNMSLIDSTLANGTYNGRIFSLDGIPDPDFNNYFNVSTLAMSSANNNVIPLSIICNIYTDEDYIYFKQTSDTNFIFTNINYCYYQYILVSSQWFRLVNITSDKVYINLIASANTILNTNQSTYQLIFSASNVTNTNIISNNYFLHDSSRLNYPIINDKVNTNIIVLLSSATNNISFILDDVTIENNILISSKFEQLKKETGYNNMTRSYFYENYIPINISNSNVITTNTLEIKEGDNIILQEITNDKNIYTHYINLSKQNNMFKISSDNNFHNINTSLFYLHNIISVKITKNNYLILVNSLVKNESIYNTIKPVNMLSRNKLMSTIYIRVNIIGKPVKETNTWTYLINFGLSRYKVASIFNRKLFYNNMIPCSIIYKSNKYYIVSKNLIDIITHVYFIEDQYINTSIISTSTLKSEYNKLDTSIFNKLFINSTKSMKLVNRVYINDFLEYYNVIIKDNLDNNTTFGIISGINYIGDSNLINEITINSDNYMIKPLYPLTGITTIQLYNLCKNYDIKSSYISSFNEISPSLPSIKSILTRMPISLSYIYNQLKPWREWSMISTRFNYNLEVYLNKNSIVYNGSIFSSETTSNYTSYFTNNEVTDIKTIISNLYKNNILQTYKIDIMNELYKVELYLSNYITLYLSQDYFWQNINTIMKELVENFIGDYKWTIYNNVIMIITDDDVLEKDLYPTNFINNNNILSRTNYISSEIDIIYNNNIITVSRNPIIIDNELNNIIEKNNSIYFSSMYGVMMDSVIILLNNMKKDRDNFITTDSIHYQYMNSEMYYITKIYNSLVTNMNQLTKLDLVTWDYDNYTSTGKKYDYLFNENYFGIMSRTKYTILDSTNINTMYIKPYNVGKLALQILDKNKINKLQTNNIFSYNLGFNDMMLQSTEMIKSSNKYTVNILDNYQHLNDIVVNEKQINADSIIFYSNKIIEPIDVSVKVEESYSITKKTDHGTIYQMSVDNIITINEKIYYNDKIVLYLENINNTEYLICTNTIDLSKSNIIKLILQVAIKSYTTNNGKTVINFSDNITTLYNYIEINDIIYNLLVNSDGYYIEDNVTINTGILYNVIRFSQINSIINNNKMIMDLELDHVIDPQSYNISDSLLDPNFIIYDSDNMINQTIELITILTHNKIRVKYNGTIGTNIIHKYNLKQSIPYRINNIVNQNKYFYEMDNINSIRMTDTIRFFNEYVSYDGTLYSVGSIVKFNLTINLITDDLNDYMMEIIKNYKLTFISSYQNTIIFSIPDDFKNYNYIYTYFIYIDGIKYNITPYITSTELIITLPTTITIYDITTINIDQIVKINNNSAKSLQYNTLYRVSTVLNSIVSNASNIYIPIIETLDDNLKEFDANYYYKFKNTLDFINNYTNIYLVDDNNYIKGVVIMIQPLYIIIGTNTIINTQSVKIYTDDFNYSAIINLSSTNYIYQKGILLEQIDDTSYYMLYSDNSLEDYDILSNTTKNTITLSFKYSNISLLNTSYPNTGFHKYPDTTKTILNETTVLNDVKWVDDMPTKFFKSIQLIIDDDIIEKLDHDIYTIYNNYMVNNRKREEFNKMTAIRYDINNNMYFYLPIIHTFTLKSKSYLPVGKMNKSNVVIKFNTNKLEDLIVHTSKLSSLKYSKQVYSKIDINYDYIITDSPFLSNNKKEPEYLLYECLYSYQNFILNNSIENNHINLYNRVIDLFVITTTKNNEYTINTIENIRDDRYIEYLDNNIIDFRIFDLIDDEIAMKSNRYVLLTNHSIISKYNIRYAMYLDEKYLQYINENLNNIDLKYSQKLTILILYFTKNHINKINIIKNNIIDTMNIIINGHDILPSLPSSYYNNTIPYLKGHILPDGYYMYSFGYDSLNSQPNGMLNLKNIKDFLIYTTQNIVNQEVKLKICSREYRILKIDGGKGNLVN